MKSFLENYKQVFAIVFIVSGLFLSSLIIFLIYFETTSKNNSLKEEKANYYLNENQNTINDFIKEHFDVVATFGNNDFYFNFLDNQNTTYFQMFLRSIQSYNKSIKNITYINSKGDELIKLKRFQPNSTFVLNHSDDLKNIASLNIFKEINKLENGDIYISEIRKNNNKKNEEDNNYELSIGYKIYDDFELVGIFILDLYIDNIFTDLVSTKNFNAYIQDENSCVLATNVKSLDLSTANDCLKTTFEAINSSTIYKSNNQKISLHLANIKDDKEFFTEINNTYFIIFIIIILISYVLSSYLANIPKKLNDKIVNQKKLFIQQSKLAAMGEMISVISHQWRQPLNEVTVIIDEIKLKYDYKVLTKEELEFLTKEIYDSVDYMSNTIEDFSSFFKPNKEKQTFIVSNMIEESLTLLKSRVTNSSVNISTKFPEKSVQCHSYKNELKQVVLNIINNAIDALNDKDIENKNIEISITSNEDNFYLNILDNAGGIPENIIENIFNPYFTTKTQKNGTGIGLYIAKLIIENNMQGELTVENKQNGAMFKIKLPIKND